MSATAHVVRIQANVHWVTFESAASRRLIGVCDELNLSLEADDQEELQSLIPEAMNLLFADLLGDNELDQFLRERGWSAEGDLARPDGDIQFKLPFQLVAAGGRCDPERHPN